MSGGMPTPGGLFEAVPVLDAKSVLGLVTPSLPSEQEAMAQIDEMIRAEATRLIRVIVASELGASDHHPRRCGWYECEGRLQRNPPRP